MEKTTNQKWTKIMVFGTFDGVHKGHLNLFKQAKRLAKNSYLVVSVARDRNVKRIKGQKPELRESHRISLVKKTGLPDKVVLAGDKKYLAHILKENPNIIALGYDQTAYVQELKKDLKIKGLNIKIVRLKPYQKHVYKNHLIKNKSL